MVLLRLAAQPLHIAGEFLGMPCGVPQSDARLVQPAGQVSLGLRGVENLEHDRSENHHDPCPALHGSPQSCRPPPALVGGLAAVSWRANCKIWSPRGLTHIASSAEAASFSTVFLMHSPQMFSDWVGVLWITASVMF